MESQASDYDDDDCLKETKPSFQGQPVSQVVEHLLWSKMKSCYLKELPCCGADALESTIDRHDDFAVDCDDGDDDGCEKRTKHADGVELPVVAACLKRKLPRSRMRSM